MDDPKTLIRFAKDATDPAGALKDRAELARCHPAVTAIVYALAGWSVERGIPGPIITGVSRNIEEQKAEYGGVFRFSFHLEGVDCGIDLRNFHYTADQRAAVLEYLKTHWTYPRYEVEDHDVGSGSHIHLAVRDSLRRRAWEEAHPDLVSPT